MNPHLLEEISMNSWAALQTVLYDGWILRYAEGFTKRANSVNPMYNSTLPMETKIRFCESFYYSKNLPPIFKMMNFSIPEDLDKELDFRGYSRIDESFMMTLDMNRSLDNEISSLEFITKEKWIPIYSYLNDIANFDIVNRMLDNNSGDCRYAIIHHNEEIVACGLIVLQSGFAGIFDVVVSKSQRRRGFGKELMIGLLLEAKKEKAHTAYLQVVKNNIVARNLYQNLGFVDEYKYWYRIKNGN